MSTYESAPYQNRCASFLRYSNNTRGHRSNTRLRNGLKAGRGEVSVDQTSKQGIKGEKRSHEGESEKEKKGLQRKE